mmetsp:Transcript_20444/g.65856  ORF Transcript_20444/g.65856 Transcript_20444/m.65856 type:complete len:148 (-) Transcript_20444:15-458(-)
MRWRLGHFQIDGVDDSHQHDQVGSGCGASQKYDVLYKEPKADPDTGKTISQILYVHTHVDKTRGERLEKIAKWPWPRPRKKRRRKPASPRPPPTPLPSPPSSPPRPSSSSPSHCGPCVTVASSHRPSSPLSSCHLVACFLLVVVAAT